MIPLGTTALPCCNKKELGNERTFDRFKPIPSKNRMVERGTEIANYLRLSRLATVMPREKLKMKRFENE